MMDDMSHLTPTDADTCHRQRADLNKFGENLEKIFGPYKPTGSKDRIKPKDNRTDLTTTTSALRGTINDGYRSNFENIFKKNVIDP